MTAVPAAEVRFAVRGLRESDCAFTYACFLRSFRESDYTEGIPNTEFFEHYKQEWTVILHRFEVLVAHPEGDEDEIAGFLAFKERTVAYVYVKKFPWRNLGVATMLMEAAGLGDGVGIQSMYGSSWALAKARDAGYRVSLLPHVEAVRLLLNVDKEERT